MPYNFTVDIFHTKKLCSRLSSSEVRFQRENGRFTFLSPPLGDLGATYDDHVKLVGKRIGNFLLVLIELFRQVIRLRRYERLSVQNQRFRSNAVTLTQNFTQKGTSPPIIFACIVRPMNALQLCTDSFHTKNFCSILSSREVRFQRKNGRFAFLSPPLGELGATYDDHLRLIGKRVEDFILVLTELFFARCYG